MTKGKKIWISILFSCSLLTSAPGYCLPVIEGFKKCFKMNDVNKPLTDTIIANGATLQLVSKQFSFTEGPASDKWGNIYFTDQPNNKIWKYDTNGKLSVFMENAGRSNGMYIDKKGNLITCADEKNEIWEISLEGKITVLLSNFKGKRLNGPNDLWVHPKKGIYFTDPFYLRSYWDRKDMEIEGQHVYFLPKGKKQPVVVANDFVKPNGIIGTPNGKYLYVADIGGNKTYRYTIGKNGKLIDKHLFANMGSDGMTIDNEGNIYLTGKGVTVFNKKGQQIEHIEVPANWTANVTFGGKDKDILFITASEGVYTLKMNVKGVNF